MELFRRNFIKSIFLLIGFVFVSCQGISSGTSSSNTSSETEDTSSQTSVTASTKDCQITSTDLGAWNTGVTIAASYFSDMVSGDYITFVTEESDTSSTYYQLQFKCGESYLSEGTCTKATYNSEYYVWGLNKAAQTTVYSPADSEIELLKTKGLYVGGCYVKLTSVTIRINASLDNDDGATIDSDLSDSNATANAKRLYQYLQDIYGEYIITGQMENAWNDDCDMLSRVYDSVEKYPALMGFDFMDYTSLGYSKTNVQTERAIKFWKGQDWDGNTMVSGQHGIVAFCWHWRDPTAESGTTGLYEPDKTDFRIPYDTDSDSWNTSSTDYTEMMADLDVIAAELLELQEAEVPVIWRPMHEGAGNVGLYNDTGVAWFWWGAGNTTSYDSENSNYTVSTDEDLCGECYIALWKLMYEYFTETKGIHNLIWLWNGQNEAFYPGDDYVDIIGDDIYDGDSDSTYGNHSSRKSVYTTYSTDMGSTTKMVCLSECGYLPNPQACYDDSAMWSFFMVWNDGDWDSTNSCVSTNTASGNFWSGTYYNSDETKSTVYNHQYALTLDELPDLTTYTTSE